MNTPKFIALSEKFALSQIYRQPCTVLVHHQTELGEILSGMFDVLSMRIIDNCSVCVWSPDIDRYYILTAEEAENSITL